MQKQENKARGSSNSLRFLLKLTNEIRRKVDLKTIMDNFTKLLLFLGQQLYLYKRRIIFVEELRQIYATDKEITNALEEPMKQSWIRPAGDEHHFEITEL